MSSAKQHITFGVFIPQGWKMELVSIADPVMKWQKTIEVAQLAEKLGYDSIWAHETVFECWTVMAAISQLTMKIRLGQMVGCNLYREPSLLAKITSTLDVISGGRLDWGIGAGWYENECRGYGFDFPEPKVRIAMLRECVEIVRSMWTNDETTFDGKHYKMVRGNCDPKPLQKPHPPIWIGGGGEQLTLRVVARYADYSNFGGNPQEFAHKIEVLKTHCLAVGRDESEINKTWSPDVFIRRTEKELKAEGSLSLRGDAFDNWQNANLVGTVEQVSEKVQKYIDLGCSGFIPWCADYPSTETVELFAEVMNNFRQLLLRTELVQR